MSIGHCDATGTGPSPEVSRCNGNGRPLHRLALVRRLQGLSRRKVAQRLNLDTEQVRRQERETADMPLSVLYAWREALDVPVAELLVDAGDPLTLPVLKRSQLVRLMKTVLAVCEHAKQESIRRMGRTMADQLIEIMPELAKVSAWHGQGQAPQSRGIGRGRPPSAGGRGLRRAGRVVQVVSCQSSVISSRTKEKNGRPGAGNRELKTDNYLLRLLSSCTVSTKATACSGGVSGSTPCPRLKIWPGWPAA